MEDFNSQFKLVCKTFPNVYGTGKYSYNKKYQLKTRMGDLNDDSDMKRYFQALCDSIRDQKSLRSEMIDYKNQVKRLNIKIENMTKQMEYLSENQSKPSKDIGITQLSVANSTIENLRNDVNSRDRTIEFYRAKVIVLQAGRARRRRDRRRRRPRPARPGQAYAFVLGALARGKIPRPISVRHEHVCARAQQLPELSSTHGAVLAAAADRLGLRGESGLSWP
eukprot:SAG22_NODE_2770_length_2226_cov_2.314998_1_plen_222_part_00